MKIDRLLAITIYLMNREVISAKELADKFEVSLRTIGRDIDSINLAGIPVVTLKGVGGGYQILDTFKMSQTANYKDLEYIITALKGLRTAFDDKEISTTLEKMKSISKNINSSYIYNVDLSVLHENQKIGECLKLFSKAIKEKKAVIIDYVNGKGYLLNRKIEPIMLNYKWYTWYLVAYCIDKKDYRIFKLSRIQKIENTKTSFGVEHNVNDKLFDTLMDNDARKYIDVKLLCNKSVHYVVEEYIPNCNIEYIEEKKFICKFHVPENERMWYALVLSLGNNAKVIQPKELINRIKKDAKELNYLYKEDI